MGTGEGGGGAGASVLLDGITSDSSGKHDASALLACAGDDGNTCGSVLLTYLGINVGGVGGEREGGDLLGNAGNAHDGGTLIGSMGSARDSGLLGGICDGGGAHGGSVILGNRRSSDTYNGGGIRRGERGNDNGGASDGMGTVTGGAGHDLC